MLKHMRHSRNFSHLGMASAKMTGFSYSCEICGVEGLNDEEMRTHMLVYHLEGAVSCPFCDLGDISADEMLLHVNSAHLEYLTPERELLAFIDDDDEEEDEEVDEDAEEMEGGRYGTPPDVPPNDLSHFRENSNSDVSNKDCHHLEHRHGLPSPFHNGAAMCPDENSMKAADDNEDDARVPNGVLLPENKENGWNDDDNNNNNSGDVDVGVYRREEKNDVPSVGPVGDRPGPLAGAGSSGSPLRSALALNLGSIAPMSGSSHGDGAVNAEGLANGVSVVRQCPLCPYRNEFPVRLEEHINRQHFDPTSPSFPSTSPLRSHSEDAPAVYDCPLCVRTFQNSPDLELHVNIEHKDILSPAKVELIEAIIVNLISQKKPARDEVAFSRNTKSYNRIKSMEILPFTDPSHFYKSVKQDLHRLNTLSAIATQRSQLN
ncbi:hypothetical protein J437_LFUL013066 [Ladona fulva]|uniref:C2H2-type domain-containing protein n=1 Tax=Ladona fulva TaxID=123851 RepID=A0A8K0KI20_LADFU|nr:hypothetical protein J437_LFUL013066 [Ladona fulva]